jgi:hypothetical protein
MSITENTYNRGILPPIVRRRAHHTHSDARLHVVASDNNLHTGGMRPSLRGYTGGARRPTAAPPQAQPPRPLYPAPIPATPEGPLDRARAAWARHRSISPGHRPPAHRPRLRAVRCSPPPGHPGIQRVPARWDVARGPLGPLAMERSTGAGGYPTNLPKGPPCGPEPVRRMTHPPGGRFHRIQGSRGSHGGMGTQAAGGDWNFQGK